MNREDTIYFCIFNITWFLLLVEHVAFELELALPFAIFWGIGTMLFNIKILWKYAFEITQE